MITADQLTKSFGTFKAVNQLSFDLKKGEIVGFLGPNGAGKTTTMRLLTGFLPPSSGRVFIDGQDVAKQGIQVRKKIGYLPESTPIYQDMGVLDYLLYIGSIRHIENLNQALKEATHLCGLTQVLQQKIGTLSKGYKQRVGLAQAILHKPEILILDEPTVGLDPNQIVEIRELIKNLGQNHTVLLSSHILSEVEQTCERVLIISGGSIVASGTPRELMDSSSGLPTFFVTIKSRCEASIFMNDPIIANAEVILQTQEATQLKVTLKSKHDSGAALFSWAVSKGLVLDELRKEEINLETVFKELTR